MPAGVSVGGMQVAFVKRSTSLRMKNLGKVPPRLETLCNTYQLSHINRVFCECAGIRGVTNM